MDNMCEVPSKGKQTTDPPATQAPTLTDKQKPSQQPLDSKTNNPQSIMGRLAKPQKQVFVPKVVKQLKKPQQSNWHDDDDDDYIDMDDDYDHDDEPFTPYTGWYTSGDGNQVYQYQGEMEDFTACGKDCGYCGRCQY